MVNQTYQLKVLEENELLQEYFSKFPFENRIRI